MKLEEAEAEMKRRTMARGVSLERERLLDDSTLAALRETGTWEKIPMADEVVLTGAVFTEKQRKLLAEFWKLRADNYTEYHKLEEFEKTLNVLREKKAEENMGKKEESRADRREGGKRKDLDYRRSDI